MSSEIIDLHSHPMFVAYHIERSKFTRQFPGVEVCPFIPPKYWGEHTANIINMEAFFIHVRSENEIKRASVRRRLFERLRNEGLEDDE